MFKLSIKDSTDHMEHVVFSSGSHRSDPKLEMKLFRSGISESYLGPDNWLHDHAQATLNALWGSWCQIYHHSTTTDFKVSVARFCELITPTLDALLDAIVNN